MNSGGWYTFLFLFILGMTCQTVNTLGFWNVHEPNSQYSVSLNQVTTFSNKATSSPLSIFVIYSWIIDFMTIVGSGLLGVLSIGVLFYAMGWPVGTVGAALLTLIQAPATLQALFWVYELLTGH